MKGHDYNVALLVFFVPYIFFEVPCPGVSTRTGHWLIFHWKYFEDQADYS